MFVWKGLVVAQISGGVEALCEPYRLVEVSILRMLVLKMLTIRIESRSRRGGRQGSEGGGMSCEGESSAFLCLFPDHS